MFLAIVSTLMLLLLFLCSGAAMYLGIFRCGKQEVSLTRKCISGIVAYSLSAVFWAGCYSYQHLGW